MHLTLLSFYCDGRLMSTFQLTAVGAGHYLVVDWPEVHVGFHRLAGDAAREHILTGVAEPVLDEDPGHVFHLSPSYSAPNLTGLDVRG